MSRKVEIEVKVRIVMDVDEGIEIADIVDEMDYSFDLPDSASLVDTEILDYEVTDSR